MATKPIKNLSKPVDPEAKKAETKRIGGLVDSTLDTAGIVSSFRKQAAQGTLTFKNFSRFLTLVNVSLYEPGNFQAKAQIECFFNSCVSKIGIGFIPLVDCSGMKDTLIDASNVTISNYAAIAGMLALSLFDNMAIYKKINPLDEDASLHGMNEHGFATFECGYINLANHIIRELRADPKYLEKDCNPDFPYGLRFSAKTFSHNCFSGLNNPPIGDLDQREFGKLFLATNLTQTEGSYKVGVPGSYGYSGTVPGQGQLFNLTTPQFNFPFSLGVNHLKLGIELKDGDQETQDKVKDLYENLFSRAKDVWLYISPTGLITNVEATVAI